MHGLPRCAPCRSASGTRWSARRRTPPPACWTSWLASTWRASLSTPGSSATTRRSCRRWPSGERSVICSLSLAFSFGFPSCQSSVGEGRGGEGESHRRLLRPPADHVVAGQVVSGPARFLCFLPGAGRGESAGSRKGESAGSWKGGGEVWAPEGRLLSLTNTLVSNQHQRGAQQLV
jgi:hypothetical protein